MIGHLAAQPNLGDIGSSKVTPPSTRTPLEGLRQALPATNITFDDGTNRASAIKTAAQADAAVVVVGYEAGDEGEMMMDPNMDLSILGWPFTTKPAKALIAKIAAWQGPRTLGTGGDRDSLTLHPEDEQLILDVTSANPRTVVVVIGGSAIIMEAWRHQAPAILMAWYPGMEGGRAIADILTGAREPGGRLPLAIPTSADHLPFFDKHATSITYDAWWGQRKLDHDGHPAAYPFGFGLGYTTFDCTLLAINGDALLVRVTNTGDREGSTVAQVYAVEESANIPQLVGFRRVRLLAGEAADITVDLDLTPMRERDPETKQWTPRLGVWHLVINN